MTLPEQGVKVANSVVDALASTPVVLALVVFNVLYMGGSFYTQLEAQKRFVESNATWERMVEKAMAFCPQQQHSSAPEISPQAIRVLQH